MKLIRLALFFLLFYSLTTRVVAQVKIGDNPNNIETASLFELESTDKGFLPPRLPLNNITTWAPLAGTAVEGMVVYSDAGALQDGFYYWDGTQWVRLSGAQDAEWLDANLNGNSLILARQAAAAGDTVVVTDDGRLGVGTVDLTRGDVVISGAFRNQPSGNANITILSNNAFAQDIGGKIALGGAASATDLTRTFASIGGLKENSTDANRAGYMQFNVRAGTTPADLYEAMRINSLGDVGIGNISPTAKLDIQQTAVTDSILIARDNNGIPALSIHPNRNIYFYPNQLNNNSYMYMHGIHGDGRWGMSGTNNYRYFTFRPASNYMGIGEGEFDAGGVTGAIGVARNPSGDDMAIIPRLAIAGRSTGPAYVSQLQLQRSDPSEWQQAAAYPSGQNYYMIRTILSGNTSPMLPFRRAPIQMGAFELTFNTSATDVPRMHIDSVGDIRLHEYPNTRNNAASIPIENLLYTDVDGKIHSTSLSAIVDSTKDADWYQVGTTDSPDDINDFIYTQGRVAIGTTTASATLNVGGSQTISFIGAASSSSLTSPGSLIINANSGNANITTRAEEFRFNGFDAGTASTVNMRGIDVNHTALTLGLNTGQVRNVMQIVDDANLPVTVFDNEGHLGIGTSAPTAELHVNANNLNVGGTHLLVEGSLNNDNVQEIAALFRMNINNRGVGINPVILDLENTNIGGAFGAYSHSYILRALGGHNSGSRDFVVTGDGRVHIGVNSKGSNEITDALQLGAVFNSTAHNFQSHSIFKFTDKNVQNDFNGNQTRTIFNIEGLGTWTHPSSPTRTIGLNVDLSTGTYTNPIAALFNGGTVGIGITTPNARLHVASGGNAANEYTAKFTSSPSVAGSGGIVFTNTEAPIATGFKWHTTGTGTGTFADDDLILSSITVASGATNTNNIFTVQGNGNIGLGVLNSANPIQHSSGARLTAAGVWTNASDRRLKNNITTTQYGLEAVMKLRPVDYTMKKGGEKQVGFIAQELQEVIPELVDGQEGDLENGETLGVAYGQMVAVLTKAMQEQQAQIEELKKQNAELAQKNLDLDNQNEKLESRINEIDQLKAELSEIKNLLKSTSSNK